MSDRTITLHTFCSVKGGVGKSTLAVVCARLLALSKRVPVLMDCDLTGTSIADGLRLVAPKIAAGADGGVDLSAAPSGEHLASVEETRRLRTERRDSGWKDRVHPPPYLNDILERRFVGSEPVRADAALWRHELADGVAYLPSSSIHHDLIRSLAWYNDREPFDWAQTFLWVLDDLARYKEDLTDVVVDLPPGTWGFPHETMVIVSTLLSGTPLPDGYPQWHKGPIRWRTNPFVVTSSDGNDLVPALEYLGRNVHDRLRTLRPLVNKVTEGPDAVRDRARRLLGPALSASGLEQSLHFVPELRFLATIFKEGAGALDDDVRALKSTLRLEDAT